jgi:hypothetical protein
MMACHRLSPSLYFPNLLTSPEVWSTHVYDLNGGLASIGTCPDGAMGLDFLDTEQMLSPAGLFPLSIVRGKTRIQ